MGRLKSYNRTAWGDRSQYDAVPAPLRRQLGPEQTRLLSPIYSIALEMALHEERERRALEGELATLEDEWREAEMLAGIADALPEDAPLDRVPRVSEPSAG